MTKIKELNEGSKVFAIINNEIREATVSIKVGRGKQQPNCYYLVYRNEKGERRKAIRNKNKNVALSMEEAEILIKKHLRNKEIKNKKTQEQLEKKRLEELKYQQNSVWYDEHLDELMKVYREELGKYDIGITIINFIENHFNNYNKYLLNCTGHERGRTYYSTTLIEDYDVNNVYDKESLADGFLSQVYTGSNEFWNYLTFYDELYRFIDEELEKLGAEVCKNFTDDDDISYWLYEETNDLRSEFRDELLYKVNWEDFKKYVK